MEVTVASGYLLQTSHKKPEERSMRFLLGFLVISPNVLGLDSRQTCSWSTQLVSGVPHRLLTPWTLLICVLAPSPDPELLLIRVGLSSLSLSYS